MKVRRKEKTNQALVTDSDGPPENPPDLPKPAGPVFEASKAESGATGKSAGLHKNAEVQKAGWEQVNGGSLKEYSKYVEDDGDKGLSPGAAQEEAPSFAEKHLKPSLYGEWWHNAAVIFVAVLLSWLWGRWRGGVLGVAFIGLVCATYYRLSVRRMRRNLRDDIHRLSVRRLLDSDHETLEWINNFLSKFWVMYEPGLSAMIVANVDQVLAENTPPFLDSLRLSTFTLGTKAPRLDHVKTYPRTEQDIVMMDWRFSFTPNDIADMTQNQLKNKVNPKVVLEIRVGKGIASAGLPVLVSDFAFSGLMRFKIKLIPTMPHIQIVDVCFLERPNFDYVLKPMGGEKLGFDVANLPGLSSFIQEQVHSNLGPMLYAPNVFTVNVEQILAGEALDAAIGVVEVTIYNARDLRSADMISGNPDPYVRLSYNGGPELARTDIKKNTRVPNYGETKYLLCNKLADQLLMEVFDFNDVRADKLLGGVSFDCSEFTPEGEAKFEGMTSDIMYTGKPRGKLHYDVMWYPAMKPRVLDDGSLEDPSPDAETGIARVTIVNAHELEHKVATTVSPKAVLLLNGREVHETPVMKKTNNPVWNNSFEFLVAMRSDCRIGLRIKDTAEKDKVIGTWQMMINDLKDSNENGNSTFDLSKPSGDGKVGQVSINVRWRPLNITGGLRGKGGYARPIGVARFNLRSAKGLHSADMFTGKSDPFVRINSPGMVYPAQTVAIKDNLNPTWNEVHYVPVRKISEKFMIEVVDMDKGNKHGSSLGFTEYRVNDIMSRDNEENWLANTEDKLITASLMSKKNRSKQGSIDFSVQFFPIINVADPEKESEAKVPDAPSDEQSQAAKAASNGSSQSLAVPQDRAVKNSADEVANAQEDLETHEEAQDTEQSKQVKMSEEELLSQNSGIVVFDILEGKMPRRNIAVNVLFDDAAYPSFVSSNSAKLDATWNEKGEGFTRDLENSQMSLILTSKSANTDEPVARVVIPTKLALSQALGKPVDFTLQTTEGRDCTIKMSMSYLPVPMELDSSEAFENEGVLEIDVVNAKDLPAADSSGKSDPYIWLAMNGERFFKTKTVKKTLNPKFNEHTSVEVPSRTMSKFLVEVFDWDFGNKADKLGEALVDMTRLEPGEAREVEVSLKPQGIVNLSISFTPQWVSRAKMGGSSTMIGGVLNLAGSLGAMPLKGIGAVGGVALAGAGAAGQLAGKGVGTAAKGVGTVGKGVGSGVGAVGKGVGGVFGIRRKHKSHAGEEANGNSSFAEDDSASMSGTGAGNDRPHSPVKPAVYDASAGNVDPEMAALNGGTTGVISGDAGARAMHLSANEGAAPENGIYEVDILKGLGFTDKKVYISVRTSKKTLYNTAAVRGPQPEFADHISSKVSTTEQIMFVAREKSTFGHDHDIGQGAYLVGDHTAGEFELPLGDSGTKLRLRVKFQTLNRQGSPQADTSAASISSPGRLSRTASRASSIMRGK